MSEKELKPFKKASPKCIKCKQPTIDIAWACKTCRNEKYFGEIAMIELSKTVDQAIKSERERFEKIIDEVKVKYEIAQTCKTKYKHIFEQVVNNLETMKSKVSK